MKILLCSCALLALIVVTGPGFVIAQDESPPVYTAVYSTVRDIPDSNGKSLGQIINYETVVITGVSPDGAFYRVDYLGQEGWVSARLGDVTGDLSAVPVIRSDDVAATDACQISTDQERDATLRVGPGINRSAILFLPAGHLFSVIGQHEADDGSLWWKLDKAEVAPESAAGELWVAQDAVDSRGDCEAIAEADAPPIVPIAGRDDNTSPEQPGARVVTVSGDPVWQNADFRVVAGQRYRITATGRVNLWRDCTTMKSSVGLPEYDCSQTLVGPNGGPDTVVNTETIPRENIPAYPLPGALLGALIARIGRGMPFVVGEQTTFTAEDSGVLWFRVNDDALKWDNDGAFSVEIVSAE